MKYFLPIIVLVFLSSCARRYRPIEPEKLSYNNEIRNNCIQYSYKYDVLLLKGNKRYSKKENKAFIKVIAVKITNISDKEINFSNDIKVNNGDTEMELVEPDVVKAKIHQRVYIYALWGLSISRIPFGIPIAVGNMIYAARANKKFRNELRKYNLINKTIKPGETKYGIISISSTSNKALSLSVRNSDCGNSANSFSVNYKENTDLINSLFYSTFDADYDGYVKRIKLLLEQDKGITEYEFVNVKHKDGTIKYRGFKAKHNYGNNKDRNYKIGTWEYYSSNGELIRSVNYDLTQNNVKSQYTK